MIVTYLRSSSYNGHTMCPHSFFLAYTLNLPSPAGKKAAKGNVTHKALELLAWQSYHRARGNASYEDETFGLLNVEDITTDWAVDSSYAHYKVEEPHHDWADRKDLKDCREWTNTVLDMNGGYFNPSNLDIIQPEQRFDITISEPWAHFEYDTPQGVVSGQLGLKGTIDLVTRDKNDPSIIEIIDYKTGRRLDWATGEEKTYAKLVDDAQLLLYHLAFSTLYPEASTLIFTMIYVNDGGPFRMVFGPEDAIRAKDLLRKKFEEIRDTQRPKLNVTWRCDRLCPFGPKSRSKQDPKKSICQYFEDEVRKKGADQVFFEHGSIEKVLSYQDGGGRKAKD